MENDSTFVAPEGVYSVIEEHRPATINPHINNTNASPATYPTKLSTVLIRYPAHNKASGSQAFAQLLGGGKEKDAKKDKGKTDDAGKDKDTHLKPPAREREDGASLSSTDTQEDGGNGSPDHSAGSPPVPDVSNTPAHEQPSTIFSTLSSTNVPGGKKKASTRPKHSIRTTSSTFVSRVQMAEGLAKHLQSRQGEVTYVFYNHVKTFIWTEVGSKVKVCLRSNALYIFGTTKKPICPATTGASYSAVLLRLPNMPRCQSRDGVSGPNGCHCRLQHGRYHLVWYAYSSVVNSCNPYTSSRTDPISNRYCRLNKQVCPAETLHLIRPAADPLRFFNWTISGSHLWLAMYSRPLGTFVSDPLPRSTRRWDYYRI